MKPNARCSHWGCFTYVLLVRFVIILYAYGMSNFIFMMQFKGIYNLCHFISCVLLNGQYYRPKKGNIYISCVLC